MWTRLIAGSDARKTRLHDRLGAKIPAGRLIRNGPRALASGLVRVIIGYQAERPWISYDAQAALRSRLNRKSLVLEFGSGRSTLWYARRARHVVAVEHDPSWFERLHPHLRACGNVEYRFAAEHEAYIALPADACFDLIVIDGAWRLSCAMVAMGHLANDGLIYLDNSDKFTDVAALLSKFAISRDMPIREFIDFAPSQMFVQRGLLIGP
jgi:hypothetical protein